MQQKINATCKLRIMHFTNTNLIEMGLTRTRSRREYAGEALAERGRFRTESKANKPIPKGFGASS